MTFDMELLIYTDGSCLMQHKDRPGGSAWVIYTRIADKEFFITEGSDGYYNTTNNQMELMAIITALGNVLKNILVDEIYSDGIKISVYTDSSWVVNCVTNADWTCTKNKKMLEYLQNFVDKYNLKLHWIKEHTSDRQDRAHVLANKEAKYLRDKG